MSGFSKDYVLYWSIKEIIKDKVATDKQKIERIETYLEIYRDLNEQSYEDMI